MSRYRQFRLRGVVLGLAAVALARVSTASQSADGPTLPKDPCALLKPAEIQAVLAPNATVGHGVPTTSTAPLAVNGSYAWGPRTPQWGESSVLVMVIDASQTWPGLSADEVRQGIMASANAAGATASPISGAGDAGVFTFQARSFNAKAEAFSKAKGVNLSVEVHGANGLSNKEKVIALLKQAAAGL